MSPEQIQHLQNVSLIASAPVAVVTFFSSYWLYKVKRTDAMYRGVTAALLLSSGLCGYLVDHTFRIVHIVVLAGVAAFYFGKVRAMDKHPEAFPFPQNEK